MEGFWKRVKKNRHGKGYLKKSLYTVARLGGVCGGVCEHIDTGAGSVAAKKDLIL